MPADERATLEKRVREYYQARDWPDELWAMGFHEAVKFAAHFVKEADRLAREDAARIVESSLFGCVWGSDILPLQKRYAAAIRASITTDEDK